MSGKGDLVRRFGREFDSSVRDRGRQYQAQGRVSIAKVGRDHVRAAVHGSGSARYAVTLSAPDDVHEAFGSFADEDTPIVEVECSCPHFARGYPCKHLFACLAELDAQKLRLDWAGNSGGYLIPRGMRETALVREPAEPRAASRREPAARAVPSALDRNWLRNAAQTDGPRTALAYRIAAAEAEQGILAIQLLEPPGDGELANPRRVVVRSGDIDARFAEADARVLRALAGCRNALALPGLGLPDSWSSVCVPHGLASVVLPLVAASGRLYDATDLSLGPLCWSSDEPLQCVLVLQPAGKRGARLVAELRRPQGERVPIEALAFLLDDDIAQVGRALFAVSPRGVADLLREFRAQGPIEIERRRLPNLMERIAQLALPPLEIAPAIGWSVGAGEPVPCLEVLRPTERTPVTRVRADVRFRYGDALYPVQGGDPAHVDRARRRVLRRNPEAERKQLAGLAELGFADLPLTDRSEGDVQIARPRLPQVLPTLLERGWDIQIEGSKLRRPGLQSLRVTTGTDWFDLEATLEFETGAVGVPELLTAVARGASTVRLADGSHGLLPEEWVARVIRLAQLGDAVDQGIRFRSHQALLLQALLDGEPDAWTDAVFRRLCRRLERVRAPRARQEPRGFQGVLRLYQREGLGWMQHLRELGLGGCLADDMGLGKTVQVLALLAALRSARRSAGEYASPALVVVPRSLIHNWLAEAARFAPALRVLDYTGPARRSERERLGELDLVLTTYGTLRRDIAKLEQTRFAYAILDEATAIKNSASQTWKAARRIRADHRLALTGTPVENHLGELWALFEFLNPGMLGSGVRSERLLEQDEAHMQAVRRALAPFLLRRTKQHVLPQLPAKTEQTLYCELQGAQRRQYDELLHHYRSALRERIRSQGMARSHMHVLEALLRLRQAACHPGLIDPARKDAPSAKLELVLPALAQAVEEGHKVLVFSQFTSFLAIVRAHFSDLDVGHEYLDGHTRRRAEVVQRFQQDPDCRIFLISLKAGGHGLNLTAADYVFLLDPWWNPAVEAQAIDRAHRIGQDRPVVAYRVVARDTIEEKILALHDTKRALADAILSANRSLLRQLTAADLEVLLA